MGVAYLEKEVGTKQCSYLLPDRVAEEYSINAKQEKEQGPFLSPNLSTFRLINEKPIGLGTGFTVYRVNQSKKPEVLKIERAFKNEQGVVHFPWRALGFGELRTSMDSITDAIERRKVHLETQKRLSRVGISVATFIGSTIISSQGEGDIITNRGPLMYAELWEDPGGDLLGSDEKYIENIYRSPQGRASLLTLAHQICTLSSQGYLYDVTGSCIVPRTPKGFPYPRNFLSSVKKGQEVQFVAIDFNSGIDLTRQTVWWKSEFSHASCIDLDKGKPHINHELFDRMSQSISLQLQQRLSLLGCDDANKTIRERLETEGAILQTQVDRLLMQTKTASEIISMINEVDKQVTTKP